MPEILKLDYELIEHAEAVSRRAYAPHSKFHVGAAVRTKTAIYIGTNFENDSYGATICAERAAIAHLIAHEGPTDRRRKVHVEHIALVGWFEPSARKRPPETMSPCGICRQVLFQFAPRAPIDFRVDGVMVTMRVEDLLPEPFKLAQVPRGRQTLRRRRRQ